MTPKDLDRYMAEKLMGWVLITPDFEDEWDHSYYTNPTNKKWYLPKEDWHPTQSIAQAFMCVEKMREKGWDLKLTMNHRLVNYFIAEWKHDIEIKSGRNMNPNPATAIIKTIYAALEGE